MNANSSHVKRTATILKPDQSRVLLQPFSPGGPQRIGRIIARIMSLPEDRVGPLLDEVSAEFSHDTSRSANCFRKRFEQVRELLLKDTIVAPDARIGYDPAQDRLRYEVTQNGIVVVCPMTEALAD
jgi:hypothetical protein